MFELFWNLDQDRRLRDANGRADRAITEAASAARRIQELEGEWIHWLSPA